MIPLRPTELIVDNFAGGGGASLGISQALGRPVDVAINHDSEAVAMHRANHPETVHLCQSVWKANPYDVAGGRRVGLAWFSPDCKHHSKAKGGKPKDKNNRDLAWVVVAWAKTVRPRVIMLENVEEFADWGPLLENGQPCPDRKGLEFRRWVRELKKCGYAVEWRELRACDYGAPTIRKRLFLIARCDGLPIVWPEPTHGPGLAPYRSAAECIDWSLPTYSIFLTREEVRARGLRIKRPLADATMRRIARGVMKYVVEAKEPFIVGVAHGDSGGRREYSIGEPLGTVTAAGKSRALVEPFIVPITHSGDLRVHDIREPLRTVTTARRGELALAAPFFVPRYGERPGQAPRAGSVEDPMPTVVPTGNGAGLVAAFMAQHNTGVIGRSVRAPLATVTTTGAQQQLVAATLSRQFGRSSGASAAEPLGTVTERGKTALVAATLSHQYGSATNGGQGDPRLPLKTVTTGGHHAVVAAFLAKYYGTGGQDQDARAPLHTVPTKARFAAVTVTIEGAEYALVDIGMRMLSQRELFRAQGFPDSYVIDPEVAGRRLTKEAQTRMCGNSVCPPIAQALVKANLRAEAMPGMAAAGS